MKKLILSIMVVLVMLFTLSSQDFSTFDTQVLAGQAAFSTPAVSVQIFSADGTVLHELNSGEGITADKVGAKGSISKTALALGVGKALTDGLITSVQDSIATYLPYWNLKDDALEAAVTIQDILSHRLTFIDPFMPVVNEKLTIKETVENLKYLDFPVPITNEGNYTNFMLILAAVIEEVSGTDFESYMSQNIFAPLGMSTARYNAYECGFPTDDLIQPYTGVWGDWDNPVEYEHYIEITPHGFNSNPIGALYCSNTDAIKMIQLIMNGGQLNGNQFIDANYMLEFLQPQSLIVNPANPYDPDLQGFLQYRAFLGINDGTTHYGYGNFQWDYFGVPIYEHAGVINGFRAMWAYSPVLQSAIIIQHNFDFNTSINNSYLAEGIVLSWIDTMLGGTINPWPVYVNSVCEGLEDGFDQLIAAAKAQKDPNNPPSLPLDAYCGVYSNDYYGDLLIKKTLDGGLRWYLYSKHSATAKMYHHFGDTFELDGQTMFIGSTCLLSAALYEIFGTAINHLPWAPDLYWNFTVENGEVTMISLNTNLFPAPFFAYPFIKQ